MLSKFKFNILNKYILISKKIIIYYFQLKINILKRYKNT